MELKPIKITADDATLAQYRRNIRDTYALASDDQVARGTAWYPNARSLALFIANGDLVKGAGTIAALSARNNWSSNQSLAADACSGNVHGHTDVTLTKVRQILAGADPVAVLGGLKTANFYRNIVDPADAVSVTIDRHAHDLAVGVRYGSADRGLSAAGRYSMLAQCYRDVVRELGILPSTLQAITWLTWIEQR